MTDPVAWLRAQLDHDERIATAAGHAGTHWAQTDWLQEPGRVEVVKPDAWSVVTYDEGNPSGHQAEHIARWDPARVLAEVQAKRAVLDWHARWSGDGGEGESALDIAIGYLAQSYADRPGFPDEWRQA